MASPHVLTDESLRRWENERILVPAGISCPLRPSPDEDVLNCPGALDSGEGFLRHKTARRLPVDQVRAKCVLHARAGSQAARQPGSQVARQPGSSFTMVLPSGAKQLR